VPAMGDTEELRSRFVAEALAAVGERERFDEAITALRQYLYALAPFSRWGDFNGEERIALPSPYHILIEPSILYGYYRAWLRRGEALPPRTIKPQAKQLLPEGQWCILPKEL
jgi:hypothetical protein